MDAVKTGMNGTGQWWARFGRHKILARADGGYARLWANQYGEWFLYGAFEHIPAAVESALCAALDLACNR
jgi:hypothetical protein